MMLSIIVPVHNEELYLDDCLASIMMQRVDVMEVLLIDDGSSDRSGAICDRWADTDKRIKVHHIQNSGIGFARNLGLEKARGDIITFVDGDDVLHSDMYSTMLELLDQLKLDVVECGYYEFGNRRNHPPKNPRLFTISSGSDVLLHCELRNIVVWNKIYRRELWNGIKFPERKMHEDEFVYFQVLYAAGAVLQIGDQYYGYRQHPESFIGKGFTKGNLDIAVARVEQVQFFAAQHEHELLNLARQKWFKTLISLIQTCVRKRHRMMAAQLRLHLFRHFSWIVGSRQYSVYRKIVMILQIPSTGRRFSLFSLAYKLREWNAKNRTNNFRKMNRLPVQIQKGRPRVFSFLEPTHGNLGDHSIVLGQERLLEKVLPGFQSIHITENECAGFLDQNRSFVKPDDIIIITGGGNLGDLYPREELLRHRIVREFPENLILSFPQSVLFRNTDHGNSMKSVARDVYLGHKRLYLFTRDPLSQKILKNIVPEKSVTVLPDTALFLDGLPKDFERDKDVLICLRNDELGSVPTLCKKDLLLFLDNLGLKYEIIDLNQNRVIDKMDRQKVVLQTFEKFGRYRWVVTDRLHGVVLSLLTGTPCLAIDIEDHKILGFFQWLNGRGDVELLEYGNHKDLIDRTSTFIERGYSHKPYDFTDSFHSAVEQLGAIIRSECTTFGIPK